MTLDEALRQAVPPLVRSENGPPRPRPQEAIGDPAPNPIRVIYAPDDAPRTRRGCGAC